MKKQSLGRMAVFLVPSLKLKLQIGRRKTAEQIIHDFLLKHFSGYTVEVGNIFGYWKNQIGKEEYGEHRRFTVAFLGKERIPVLERFLERLAAKLNEKCIYLETGEDAWLIYARKPRKGKRNGRVHFRAV